MNILWLSWKDINHPHKGGAEVVTNAICSRLAKDGHAVTLLTAHYEDALHDDTINGYHVIRVGGKFTVYWHAFRYYRKFLRGKFDYIIEEVNTIPFFSKFYASERSVLFFHQLAREIWFYQMFFPLSLIGYLLEPLYLRLLSKSQVITVSESTKHDLMRYGFQEEDISIISEGIDLTPIENLNQQKSGTPTILSLGSVRPMKRTLDIVKAFEMLKSQPTTLASRLKLVLAGDASGAYGESLRAYVERSAWKGDIHILGSVSMKQKIELYRAVSVLVVTSLKEGWGLVVTEANSQGTPAVVYNVDGLRDSVRNGETGIITSENSPKGLADALGALLEDTEGYARMRKAGYEWSKQITFEKQYEEFKKAVKI